MKQRGQHLRSHLTESASAGNYDEFLPSHGVIVPASTHHSLPSVGVERLQNLLALRAHVAPMRHLHFYPFGNTSTPKTLSYRELYEEALLNSHKLRSLEGFRHGHPVLLLFDDHEDSILWFWATLLAEAIPVLSPPLSHVDEQRRLHLKALSELLESPICITRASSMRHLECASQLFKLVAVEKLKTSSDDFLNNDSYCSGPVQITPPVVSIKPLDKQKSTSEAAVLMLTSGTTGGPKAVSLSHTQLITAIVSKAAVRRVPADSAFFNWIGMDHVAGLVEIHLQALWLGLDQAHAQAADMLTDPRAFLNLLGRHRASRTFAPNFFLAKLVSACTESQRKMTRYGKGNNLGATDTSGQSLFDIDLSGLVSVQTGGEANDVATCVAASTLLSALGAPANVIVPGFGMTETCAGSIYNINCPMYDVRQGLTVSTVGQCISAMEMRVVDAAGAPAATGEVNELQVRGTVVFRGYYRNPRATADAFTSDGWFRTGDRAYIDLNGNLHLSGRSKDVLNVNGVKIPLWELQATLEIATQDSCVSRIVGFPVRLQGSPTEQLAVAYITKNWPLALEDLVDVDRRALEACMRVNASCNPLIFAVSSTTKPILPSSTLGKISAAKMRKLFESGAFHADVQRHQKASQLYASEAQQTSRPLTESELRLRDDFVALRDLDPATITSQSSVFALGFTSMDIIRLKNLLDQRLGIEVSTMLLMRYPVLEELAAELNNLKSASEQSLYLEYEVPNGRSPPPAAVPYDPVVVLCPSGSKSPLWLVHSGVGEVLVFVGLAKYMQADNRPVYALRARGFEHGQDTFGSIDEAVDTYISAIRKRQPHGPYNLAGYSYGTMLAFEMTKKLEIAGEKVPFLGSFNLPPHIKKRMRQLSWNMAILHLAQFLDLMNEDRIEAEILCDEASFRKLSKEDAMNKVLSHSDTKRYRDLGLSMKALFRWTDVAYDLPHMAIDYEPSGSVQGIDVFHANPLALAAKSREEWVTEHLSRWQDYSTTAPRMHTVGGAHYTMLGPDYVESFAKTLRDAMAARE